MSLVGRTWSSASQFSPTDIAGLSLWLDAADSNSFIYTTGSNIYRWLDKSGGSNHGDISANIVQAGGSPTRVSNAINGLPAVSFASSNSFNGTLNGYFQTITGFAVARPQLSAVGRDRQTILGAAVGAGSDIGNTVFSIFVGSNINTLQFQRNHGSTPPRFDISADISLGRPILISWTSDLVSNFLWKNGSSRDVSDNGRTTGVGYSLQTYSVGRATAGGATNFVGQVGEIVLYSSFLETSQRNLVERYLATKWGFTLPSNNFYSAISRAPPTRDFSPLDVSGLTFWIDAQDLCGFDLSGSSTSIVSQVRDKSSNRAALGRTINYTWGRTQFNGAYPSFQSTVGGTLASNTVATIATPCTFYVVAQATTQSTANWLLETGGGIPLQISNGVSYNGYTISNNSDASGPYIFSMSLQGATTGTYTYLNGFPATGPFVYGGVGFTLGNRISRAAPYIGHICEMLIYSSNHYTSQRALIEGYLAQRWGLGDKTGTTSSFYSGGTWRNPVHPYRYTPSPIVSPTDLSNLRLWIDALDPCGSVVSAGSVTRVLDKSPCNWTFSNAVGAWRRTTFLKGNAAFFGSNGALAQNTTFDVCQPVTIYWFGSFPNGVGTNTVLIDGSQAVSRILISGPNTLNAGGAVTHTGNVPVSGPYFVTAAVNSNATRFSINGLASNDISVGNGRMGGVRIGAGSPGNMVGFVAEVLLYAGSHSVTQQQQLEGYLMWKWGAQAAMPSFTWARSYRAMSPIFSPPNVAGLSLWLDSADNTTLTLSGNAVTRWADKSGLQNDASGGVSPTWSSNGIVFDGTTTYLATPYTASPTAESIFAVMTWTGSTDTSYVLLGASVAGGGRSFLVQQAAGLTSILWDGGWGVRIGGRTYGITSNVRILTTGLYGASRVYSSINGGALTSNSPFPLSGTPTTYVGAGPSGSANFNGTIHEIVVYSRQLADPERQSVEGYLAWKWGLAKDLSLANPYKSFKP